MLTSYKKILRVKALCQVQVLKILTKNVFRKSDTFEDWESAEKQVEIYSKVVGFGVVKRRLEKNNHGEVIRCTFECQNSGEYCVKKRADIEETRERDSVKIKCS
ncbi:unnamed protein product [Rhizophagus irregularis]|nr:unnamed protein product [Rhizophagus irregularis]CAB4429889.1 unnamed protein product [Rhizophagus irregularis]